MTLWRAALVGAGRVAAPHRPARRTAMRADAAPRSGAFQRHKSPIRCSASTPALLCLSTQSKGLICANVIDQVPGATLQVPEGLLPEVQEQNLIRFIGQVHLSC